jgi:ferric-dicitrate binding protein FerR (iron transport regulator)
MNILKHYPDEKYKSCTGEELLQDDFFILSMTHPTESTDAFWRKLLENGDINIEDYRFARDFVESVQVRSETIREDEKETLWENIEARNRNFQKKRQKRRRTLFYLSAVASVALLVTFGFLFFRSETAGNNHRTRIEEIKAPDIQAEKIQLVLTGDEAVSLEGKEAEITYNEHGIEINKQATELKKEKTGNAIEYNQLIVPRGKRSTLTLADGTQMWVNASTRVVYPVTFDKRQREIYVDGEIFLDVAHRDGCPFVVKTKTFNAEVLGTSFNVMAYENDEEKKLVLVSGNVRIHAGDAKDIVLSPSEMFTSVNGSVQVQTVQTEYYTSWKCGVYRYESESLSAILKRLSHYYGHEIVYDSQIASMKCSGKLDLKDDLGDVLKGIAQTAPVRYRYNYETHIITNK